MKVIMNHAISSCLSAIMLTVFTVFTMPSVAGPVDVQLIDRHGKTIGSARFTPEESGVKIQMQVSGLASGKHGLHIHSSGVCEPPAFKSAGAHFSPENHNHGFLDSRGPHEGDLPVLDVASDGEVAAYDFTTNRVSLSRDSLQQSRGTSLIIHAKPDDYLTDSGGGSGDRIACGVIHPGTGKKE